MATKHEIIKWKTISDWSVSGRGRLYCMNQGLAYPVRKGPGGVTIPAEFPLWFGPLKRKFKGFPDLFGFEFVETPKGFLWTHNKKLFKLPIYCVIEVKTLKDRLRKAQKDYLNYAVSIGARAYVAREIENGYKLTPWGI